MFRAVSHALIYRCPVQVGLSFLALSLALRLFIISSRYVSCVHTHAVCVCVCVYACVCVCVFACVRVYDEVDLAEVGCGWLEVPQSFSPNFSASQFLGKHLVTGLLWELHTVVDATTDSYANGE
jgi:hypothetical protein